MNFAPHPGATRQMPPPRGWDPAKHGECGTLEIADVTGQGGVPFMESLWRPSADDLRALNVGASIVLGISGTVHPVVYLGVSLMPQHDTPAETPR